MRQEFIITDPQVLDGKPFIQGTNITVESLIDQLAGAEAYNDLLEAHPQLTREAIRAALEFAKEAVQTAQPDTGCDEPLSMMHAVIESTADGVIIVDSDNNMLICNQKFLKMWKLPQTWPTLPTYKARLEMLTRQIKDPAGYIRRVEALNCRSDSEGYDLVELKDGRIFERYATPYTIDNQIVGRVWSFRDVTDRERADAELRASRARLKAIFDNVAVGIALVDTEGRYAQTNEQWDRMLDRHNLEDPSTVELDIAAQSENAAISRKQLQALVRGDIDAYHTERRIVHEDNSIFWGDLSVSPIRDADGNLQAIICLIVDITERKQTEAEREQLIVELDAFAHTVAHDLKNPLSTVLGYVELLRMDFRKMADEEMQNFLNTIMHNGQRIYNIIDELLLLASVRKPDEVNVTALDMPHIIQDAEERLALMLEESKVEIKFTTPPEDWPIAVGYAPWVAEVWTNYLSNAIKYGTDGPDAPHIELGASWIPVQDMVRFWVRDYGPGIAPADQQRLFTKFTRLDETRAGGHGLGLSIVQRIIGKLGGETGVESTPGLGSTFYFTLPCAD